MTETINIWSGEAALYNEARPHAPTILLDICTQLAHLSEPPVVVDLGSGTGFSTVLWAERARQVIGIEPNAEMRAQAEHQRTLFPYGERIQYRDGLSTQTGLLADSIDIVTCSQSLHWMEPEATFAEAARILRSGGLFMAYDYDWPPTVPWQVEQAYHDVIARFRRIRVERAIERGVKSWSKDKHLTRIQESGQFRYVKELAVHHTEEGNAERFIALTLSYGIARYLKHGYLTEQEVGLDHLKRLAYDFIGAESIPWYFSYRIRIGIK
jgi:ubiquinone/menaquinone biosynthesis C-methylase UbiE